MTDMHDPARSLREEGFAMLPSARMQTWLGAAWSGWAFLAESWNDLAEDRYMADGGRYRRRRYAVLEASADRVTRQPHQPHYQAKVYNRLNGGLERWFEPVPPAVTDTPLLQALVRHLAGMFGALAPVHDAHRPWHVELHQFRIEAHAGEPGRPTPEGAHRDGVDWAFVMLINRVNVASGVTEIFDPRGAPLGRFTLADPGDAVFLDDARVFHGVTPIAPLDPARPAIRDVLVITFKPGA
jgi:hypothetical protein